MLYDVIGLYCETDNADELRKPGFSNQLRPQPHIMWIFSPGSPSSDSMVDLTEDRYKWFKTTGYRSL